MEAYLDNWRDIAEEAICARYAKRTADSSLPSVVFILGSPRTGSTFLYQLTVAAFCLPYFSNYVEKYFNTHPLLGLAIQQQARRDDQIAFDSRLGKTDGWFQPSEASNVMRTWFGGGHPSELVSSDFIGQGESKCRSTISAAMSMHQAPLVIKNAWNCFRIAALARAITDAVFIWIRRDLRASAKSDLAARYKVHGNPNCWNSATPANVEMLLQKPYWEQVLENQFEFARVIEEGLFNHASGRWLELWHEDVVANVDSAIAQVGRHIGLPIEKVTTPSYASRITNGTSILDLSESDISSIDDYYEDNIDRFAKLTYQQPAIGAAT